MIMIRLAISATFFCFTICSSIASGQERVQSDHFEQTIRPLLIARCIDCHGPDRQEASLRLDSRAGWMKGGERGSAIRPSDPAGSLLLRAVMHNDQLARSIPPRSVARIGLRRLWMLSF